MFCAVSLFLCFFQDQAHPHHEPARRILEDGSCGAREQAVEEGRGRRRDWANATDRIEEPGAAQAWQGAAEGGLCCWWFLPPLITSVLSEPALLLWGLRRVVSVRLPWPSVGRNLGTVGWRVEWGVVV